MREIWKPIAHFPAYEVSSTGRVRSRFGSRFKKAKELISLIPDADGYLCCHLRRDKRDHFAKVHQLVALAFVGPRPSTVHQVAHGDGRNQNNSADNLRWATGKENSADAIKHGRSTRGTRHPMAKLNEKIVRDIRLRIKAGAIQRRIAEHYNISPALVCLIGSYSVWADVKLDP